MSAPVSPEEVCNLSLDLLRHNAQVTDITNDPQTEEEALGSRWYDALRLACLRMFPWNFARKRAILNRNVVAPLFGYTDAYDLPSDYVGIIFLGENDTDYAGVEFSVEGRQILLDNSGASTLEVCYIYNVEEVMYFDPIFLMLLVAELSVVFGNAIAGLNKSVKIVESMRDRWELKARAKNGHENPIRVTHSSPIIDARRNATSRLSSDGQHLFTS